MSNEKFVRWQNNTLQQMGQAINLILLLSTGILSFEINMIMSKDFDSDYDLTFKTLLLISLVIILICTILGLLITINRLRDFRLTMKIVKNEITKVEKEELTLVNKFQGKTTWVLFYSQVASLGLSVIFLVIAIINKMIY